MRNYSLILIFQTAMTLSRTVVDSRPMTRLPMTTTTESPPDPSNKAKYTKIIS